MDDTFGIYFHWPFCLSKCPYCDFNSHVAASIDQESWRRALLRELAHFAPETAGRRVSSIFFGGGTPSLMAPATTAALLEAVAGHWPLDDHIEITLEANPGTIDADRFHAFRAAGVNRLSMGLQALDDASLRFLGRRHDVAQATAAVALARDIFPRISFDLIYARPGQTPAAWALELQRAITLAADHLSLYQLTIEPGTAFHPAHARGDFQLPDEDAAADMFELTATLTAASGLPAYEISNHARPGAECRHNLLYWRGADYLGIGPGAHGRLTDRSGRVSALNQHRAPETWLSAVERDGHGTRDRIALSGEERRAELVMMGLRLTEGLSASRFARQTGLALRGALNHSGLETMCGEGFLRWDGDHLQATDKGRLVLNSVIGALLV
ncbi:radical SAM family heme chaperone HemW [Telmatospirillum siberiense]|uniref:Heme chaperone HemW n=1 Tax=Telmatospirillum siberiense TaxID=382514 RepID=A0A2N3PSU0_9PROT|nr:radical SAM family heme chaperone HemW [Telmatospirillum siberiense]PKU23475.1 coproporphyrinogen III oxidase [Telmatospirillum siberiense]